MIIEWIEKGKTDETKEIKLWTVKKDDKGHDVKHLSVGSLIISNTMFETFFNREVDVLIIKNLNLRHKATGKEIEERFGSWVSVWGLKEYQLAQIFYFIRDHSALHFRDIGETSADKD